MNAIRRHPKTVIGGAIVGVLALAGAAIAAILLTSSLSGTASASSSKASDDIVTAKVSNSADMDCSGISISDDGESVTFNPVIDEVVAGEGEDSATSAGQDTLAGWCNVRFAVKNTGDATLYLNDYSGSLPQGWTAKAVSMPDLPVSPGETANVTIKFSANDNAKGGEITGKVVTSTSNS